MNLTKQQLLLGLVLVVTLWLSWQASQTEEVTANATYNAAPAAENATSDRNTATRFSINKRLFHLSDTNLFPSTHYKQQAHAIPEIVKQPSLPVVKKAPPLPFKFLGRWEDARGAHIFIDVAGEVVPVEVGKTIQQKYRVIDIRETPEETSIDFLYMLLNQKQTLSIGKNKDAI